MKHRVSATASTTFQSSTTTTSTWPQKPPNKVKFIRQSRVPIQTFAAPSFEEAIYAIHETILENELFYCPKFDSQPGPANQIIEAYHNFVLDQSHQLETSEKMNHLLRLVNQKEISKEKKNKK